MGREPRQSPQADTLDSALTRKANLEADLLQEQLKPRSRRLETIKVAAGASGLLLAVVSLGGGLFSVVSWFHDQEQNRELRVEERLERTLNQLSEQRPTQRVAAVGSLSSFLGNDEARNRRVVVAVANAIALEENQVARNAMVTFFVDLDPSIVHRPSLDTALVTLVSHNRGMMSDRRLWRRSPGHNWRLFADTDPQGQRLDALMRAAIALMRHGARATDMSGLYLVRANLSGLNLAGTNFNDTFLNWSNLSDAILRDASFDGANLQRTSFARADLRNAKLVLTPDSPDSPRFSFIEYDLLASLSREARIHPSMGFVSLPTFECADLRGASFFGYPVWNLTSDDVRAEESMGYWTNFVGANLAGAHFEHMGIFYLQSLGPGEHPSPPFTFESSHGAVSEEGDFAVLKNAFTDQTRIAQRISDFEEAFGELRETFGGSNIAGAHFPAALRPHLPRTSPHPSGYLPCRPRAPW